MSFDNNWEPLKLVEKFVPIFVMFWGQECVSEGGVTDGALGEIVIPYHESVIKWWEMVEHALIGLK